MKIKEYTRSQIQQRLMATLVFFIAFSQYSLGQLTVLPNNGAGSQQSSPQGGIQYQRGFYLITPAEMQASHIVNNTNINSIGFTLAAPQSFATRGGFKLYLQNTTDTIGRNDTAWTIVNVPSGSNLSLSGLVPADYEWQVRSNCATNSPYSSSVFFSTDNLLGCQAPVNAAMQSISTTSATFAWTSPSSTVNKYYIQYKAIDSANWILDSTVSNETTFTATGLIQNKTYIWQVYAGCAGSSSDAIGTSFTTLSSDCGTPASLVVGLLNTDTARLSWAAVSGSNYYSVRYRRIGSLTWYTANSITNNIKIDTLIEAGTNYEWGVSAYCATGAGAFADGPNFITPGTLVCYTPEALFTSTITNSSAQLQWTASAGSSSYTVRYRAKETVSWSTAISGMTQVNVPNDSLWIPATTGKYKIDFSLPSPFNYTSSGLYVACEFSNDSTNLPTSNITLSTDANASIIGQDEQDSVNLMRSFVGKGSALPTILPSTKYRPETRLGSADYADSVEVLNVYALGNIAPMFTNNPIQGLISNHSGSEKTFTVYLDVKSNTGINRYATSTSLTVGPDTIGRVNFTGWAPSVQEKDSIIIRIEAQTGENIVSNNRNFYIQQVTGNLVSHADNNGPITEGGFDTNDGLILVKHHMLACGTVNAVKAYLTPGAKNKQLFAVALNTSGTIIARSDTLTVPESFVNSYNSFYFNAPPSLSNEDYYIGIAQVDAPEGFMPLGIQWEGDSIRDNAYFRSAIDASGLVEFKSAGRPMIMAELIANSGAVKINGSLTLCPSGTNTLTAVGGEKRFANRVLGFSSQNSTHDYGAVQVLGIPDVYPTYGVNKKSWTSETADSSREYLVLQFPGAAHVNYIEIYETFNPGSIDTVFVKNASGVYETVYTGNAQSTGEASNIKRITFTETSFNVSEVRIAMNSGAVNGFNAIDAVAIGKETNPSSFSSYLWSPGGETTDTKSVSSPGTYSVTVTSSGCTYTDQVVVTSRVQVIPTISADGPLSLCPGDSVTLTSSQLSGNTWSNGATSKSIVVKTAGNFTVTYNDGSGCSNTQSTATVVTMNSTPTVNISGTLQICQGNNTTLNAGSHSSYLWNTGATTQTIMVGTPGQYSVIVTNAAGCKATSAQVTTMYTTLSAPTITGNLSFCQGGNTTLDAGSGYASYAWSTGVSSQTALVNGAGFYSVTVTNAAGCSASNSVNTQIFANPVPSISGKGGYCPAGNVTLTATPGYSGYLWNNTSITPSITVSAVGNYTVTVTDNNGCQGSATRNIVAYSNPVPVIGGTLSFCGGSSTLLSVGGSYTAYLWSTNATTPAITANQVTNYSVMVTDNNGCKGSANVNTNSTGVVPASPGSITGAVVVSCNSQGTYSIIAVPNTSHYVWTAPRGASIVSGQGSTSVIVSFPANYGGGKLVVAASNACGQSNSLTERSLFIQSVPETPGSISGQVNGDCGTIKTFSIAAVPIATSYTWTLPAGASFVSGQGTTSITIQTTSTFTFGNICVKANNACGSGPSSCLQITGFPAQPTGISGPTSNCSSATGVLYSVASVPGATSYIWTVPQGAQITSGQGNNSITVKWGTREGLVTCFAKNNCGSSTVTSLAVAIATCFASGPAYSSLTEIRPIPEIISAYGGMSTVRNFILEWTLGEPKTETENNGQILYTQGFHQPLIMSRTNQDSISVYTGIKKITVYPNPVMEILYVKFETSVVQKVSLEISDVLGRILQRKVALTGMRTEELNMHHYTPGSYVLVVRDERGKIISTVKLLKLDK